MTKYGNTRKDKFIEKFPLASIDSVDDRLTQLCKFNFAYFDAQPASQEFHQWSHEQLHRLLNKLRDYCREPLSYWKNMPVGKSGTVLAIYGNFPSKTDFSIPKHVPHQAQWGRFRLESAVRLIGFVLPTDCHGKEHSKTGERFDCNTFYVVFLDADHRFYKCGEAK